MNAKQIFGLILLLMVGMHIKAQSYIKLDPAQLPNNVITITPVTPGGVPEDPMAGNSNQTLEYKWVRKPYNYGTFPVGYVYVGYYYLPSAFEIYIKADYNEGTNQENGASNGLVKAVSGEFIPVISGITTNNTVRRVLTQWVKVKDFSQLSIGSYDVTINYYLSW